MRQPARWVAVGRRLATRAVRHIRRPAHATTLALTVLLAPGQVFAQSAPLPALKAAFVLNFAKFTVWPEGTMAASGAMELCVLGDAQVADALEELVKGHTASNHVIAVRRVKPDDTLRACHVLYAKGMDGQQTNQLLEAIKGSAIFTISDDEHFTHRGGVANLFVEGDKMRFAINVEAARRVRLLLSAKLLAMAQIVKDGE